MFKAFLLSIVFVLVCAVVVFPQELVLEPHGVNPGVVGADTVGNPDYVGIYDRVYTGLKNVGVESKVFLMATLKNEDGEDSTKTNIVWDLYEVPNNSEASLSEKTDISDASEIVTFIPDLVGTYRITISEGTLADTVVINASTYRGVGVCGNANCHGGGITNTFEPWSMTGHATMLDRGLDGEVSSHYGESCISCHTVGWDTLATNGGFDDFMAKYGYEGGFVFPGTLYVGMADSMYKEYPEAMALGNIQCESCHGPGNAHAESFGGTTNSKMVKNLGPDNCASCHSDGSHHVFPDQWAYSVHAKGEETFDLSHGTSCLRCHNGQGFVDAVYDRANTVTGKVLITCATCHDPHDATNDHQLRVLTATLGNGEEVSGAGYGALCMNCHKGRRNAVEYVTDYLDNLSSHYGPHHGPQADLLVGANAWTWGETLPKSPHLQATGNACVTCHMYEQDAHDAEGNLVTAGMHTFSMVDANGVDNVAACEDCHGNIGETFAEKKYYLNGNADHDGDGVEEGLQEEIEGLLDTLASVLPQNDDGEVEINDSTITLTEAGAGFNYFLIEEDRSMGIHNPAFAVALLKLSIAKVRDEALSINPIVGVTPVEYSLSQNYPNPFNPTTQIEFSIKKAGKVTLKIYDVLGREVQTLVNEEMQPGSYKAEFDGAGLATGVYMYRIVADEFTMIKKMVLIK